MRRRRCQMCGEPSRKTRKFFLADMKPVGDMYRRPDELTARLVTLRMAGRDPRIQRLCETCQQSPIRIGSGEDFEVEIQLPFQSNPALAVANTVKVFYTLFREIAK